MDGEKLSNSNERNQSNAEKVLGTMPDFEKRKLRSKDDIRTEICERLDTNEKIEKFLKNRFRELDSITEEKVVGQNYTDSFRDFISSKVHYKSTDKLLGNEAPDLVYDDERPYKELITKLNQKGSYNIPFLCNKIFDIVDRYLPSRDKVGLERMDTYSGAVDGKISIREISKRGIAFCSEKAGLAHNMFKLLGIDSETVIGAKDSEMHAYNLIYPGGYDSEPAVLYDSTRFVDFVNDDGKRTSLGYFKVLSEGELEELKSGKPLMVKDLSATEKSYKKIYNLDGFTIKDEESEYVYGLGPAKKYLESRDD